MRHLPFEPWPFNEPTAKVLGSAADRVEPGGQGVIGWNRRSFSPRCWCWDEALAVGVYHHERLNRDYPRIQIVTVQEMIEEHRRIDLPLSLDVLKSAAVAITGDQRALGWWNLA